MARSSVTLIALIVSCAAFMQALDGTVITTALPRMAVDFGVGPVDLGIGVTAYLMTAAIFIPLSGWIADRLGARTVFAGAVGTFTLASALCGMSHGLWEFTAARVLQGIGGSLMLPVGQLILLRGTEKRDLVRAITIATTPGLVAPVIGPPLGGFLTTYAGWPWIFYLNLPIGLVGMLLILRYLPNPKGAREQPFDASGFALNGLAVAVLVYGLDRVGGVGRDWPIALAIVAGGVALAALAIRHARRTPHPIVPLSPLRVQSFAATCVTGGTPLRLQVRIMPFVLPLMFQVGFGMSAFVSGLLFLGHTAGDLVMKTVTTQIMRRFGFRSVFLVTTVLFAVSIACCALFSTTTPVWVIFAVLAASGAARSPLFTAITTLAYADIPPEELSGATALSNVVNQLTGAFGVSLAQLMLNLFAALHGAPGGAPGVADFQLTLLLAGLIALSSVLAFRRLPAHVGAEVSGHRAGGRGAPAPAAEID